MLNHDLNTPTNIQHNISNNSGSNLSSHFSNNYRRRLMFATLIFVILASAVHSNIAIAKSTLLKNIRIISGENPKAGPLTQVLIDNGKIVSIGKTDTLPDSEYDAKGKFLVPGLIDSHVHLEGIPGIREIDKVAADIINTANRQIPRSYLYFGFTSVLDLASHNDFIQQWNANKYAPNAYFCSAVPIPNGYPLSWIAKGNQFKHPVARHIMYDKRQADAYPEDFNREEHSPTALAKDIKKNGARCIKVHYEPGFRPNSKLPTPTIKMVTDLIHASHKQKLPVFLHANSKKAYEFALSVRPDIIAHGMWKWANLEKKQHHRLGEFADRVAMSDIAIQPTIQVIYGEQELFNPGFFEEDHLEHAIPEALMNWYKSDAGQWMKIKPGWQLSEKTLSEAELYKEIKTAYSNSFSIVNKMTYNLNQRKSTLLFGSDTPSGHFYTQFPGINGRWEMDRWINAGISLENLFEALTINNAKALKLDWLIGSVSPGKQADLLLLKDNPLKNVSAYNSIDKIILRGEILDRAQFSAKGA